MEILVFELPHCYFFEIHCSKLKPNPICNLVQPSIGCISHGVFFFCISKHPLNSLTSH